MPCTVKVKIFIPTSPAEVFAFLDDLDRMARLWPDGTKTTLSELPDGSQRVVAEWAEPDGQVVHNTVDTVERVKDERIVRKLHTAPFWQARSAERLSTTVLRQVNNGTLVTRSIRHRLSPYGYDLYLSSSRLYHALRRACYRSLEEVRDAILSDLGGSVETQQSPAREPRAAGMAPTERSGPPRRKWRITVGPFVAAALAAGIFALVS